MKLALELTKEQHRRIAKNARHFGFDVSEYLRFVASQEVRQMSKATERTVLHAMDAHRRGKTITASSFAKTFGTSSAA